MTEQRYQAVLAVSGVFPSPGTFGPRVPQSCSATISIAPHGHSATQMPQPLQ